METLTYYLQTIVTLLASIWLAITTYDNRGIKRKMLISAGLAIVTAATFLLRVAHIFGFTTK